MNILLLVNIISRVRGGEHSSSLIGDSSEPQVSGSLFHIFGEQKLKAASPGEDMSHKISKVWTVHRETIVYLRSILWRSILWRQEVELHYLLYWYGKYI